MRIVPVPCLADNYAYLVCNGDRAAVVDPSEPDPIVAAARELGVRIEAIVCTHHHPDHVAGLTDLVEQIGRPLPVYAHEHDRARIQGVTELLRDASELDVVGLDVQARHVPGHTLGALAYVVEGKAVFAGDTLFAGGCGRLFEGSAAMLHASLAHGFGALDGRVELYPGHEYADRNLTFARSVEPGNEALRMRLAGVRARRAREEFCVPSTMADERATNPFLRCDAPDVRAFARRSGDVDGDDPVAVFAAVRRARDTF